MKSLLLAASAAFAVVAMAAPASAIYLPTGPQTNVALSTVTGGGWTMCYQATMDVAFGSSATAATSACGNGKIMLAGRETGSDTLLALAQADYADVFFNTGADDNGVTHLANGTGWYNADNWSWGFAPGGEAVRKVECDINAGLGRICLHTFDFVGGYRINNVLGLNGSPDYEKLVFSFGGGGGVPEPATWALMIGGFGMAGAALRRRRIVAA